MQVQSQITPEFSVSSMNPDRLEPSSRVKLIPGTAVSGGVGNLTSLIGFLCRVPSEDPIQLLK